jgi:Na+-transporting NADH:ubiquinone oxidoreductase subunit C
VEEEKDGHARGRGDPMRDKPWYPVLYMFVITAFFSSILIGLARFTQGRVDLNRQLAVERAVLECLPVELSPKAPSLEVHETFQERVSGPTPSSGGAYLLTEEDRVVAYAVPLDGKGFWDKIRGFIGIDTDMYTVTGISFYEQNETPGLGAEIVQPPFRSQFVGKRVSEGEKAIGILPAGSSLGDSEVHAVTGATQTSTRLERIINEDLILWRTIVQSNGDPDS